MNIYLARRLPQKSCSSWGEAICPPALSLFSAVAKEGGQASLFIGQVLVNFPEKGEERLVPASLSRLSPSSGLRVGSSLKEAKSSLEHKSAREDFHSISTSSPTIDAKRRDKLLEDILHDYYISRDRIESVLTEGHLTLSEGHYVQLMIVKENEQRKKEEEIEGNKATSYVLEDERYASYEDIHQAKQPIELDDLFKPSEDKKPLQRQLILGRAGIGKSTLCQYIANCWARTCKELTGESKEEIKDRKSIVKELWKDRFTAVFWISLREILHYPEEKYTREDHPSISGILLYLIRECWGKDPLNDLSHEHISNYLRTHRDSTLFLLDGLDEVAEYVERKTTPAGKALNVLFSQKQWLVTSRPDFLQPFIKNVGVQRVLENIGFNNEQIKQFINHFFVVHKKTSAAGPLLNYLKQNLGVWGIAHIPINLALICGICYQDADRRKKISKEALLEDIRTMTGLYNRIIDALFDRYAQKQKPGSLNFSPFSTENRNALLLPFFTQLAFTQLRDEKKGLIIKAEDMNEVFKIVWIQQARTYKEKFLQLIGVQGNVTISPEGVLSIYINGKGVLTPEKLVALQDKTFKQIRKVGLLKATGGSLHKVETQKEYYFSHLTIQEFLAALYVVQGLNENTGTTYEEVLNFILTQKYNPLYRLVLRFIAGLLNETKDNIPQLKLFWQTLLINHDLTGFGQVSLLLNCLEETGQNPTILHMKELKILLGKWIKALIAKPDAVYNENLLRILQRSPAILRGVIFAGREENWFNGLFENLKSANQRDIFMAVNLLGRLGAGIATPVLIADLIQILNESSNDRIKEITASTLGLWSASAIIPDRMVDSLSKSLWKALRGSRAVSHYASVALGHLDLSRNIDELHEVLKEDKEWVKCNAIGLIPRLKPELIPSFIPILLNALEEPKFSVISMAAKILAELQHIIGTSRLIDNLFEYKAIPGAILALGYMGPPLINPETIHILLKALQSENVNFQEYALAALGRLGPKVLEQTGVILGICKALNSFNTIVKMKAAEAIARWGEAAAKEEIIVALLACLEREEHSRVKQFIAEAFGRMAVNISNQEKVISSLLTLLEDPDEFVSKASIDALKRLGPDAISRAVYILLEILNDRKISLKIKDKEKRDFKCNALKNLGYLGEMAAIHSEVISTLCRFIEEDDEWQGRIALFTFRQSISITTTPQIIHTLLKVLASKKDLLKPDAVEILNRMNLTDYLSCHPEDLLKLTVLAEQGRYLKSTSIKSLFHAYNSYPDTKVSIFLLNCALQRGISLVLKERGLIIYEGKPEEIPLEESRVEMLKKTALQLCEENELPLIDVRNLEECSIKGSPEDIQFTEEKKTQLVRSTQLMYGPKKEHTDDDKAPPQADRLLYTENSTKIASIIGNIKNKKFDQAIQQLFSETKSAVRVSLAKEFFIAFDAESETDKAHFSHDARESLQFMIDAFLRGDKINEKTGAKAAKRMPSTPAVATSPEGLSSASPKLEVPKAGAPITPAKTAIAVSAESAASASTRSSVTAAPKAATEAGARLGARGDDGQTSYEETRRRIERENQEAKLKALERGSGSANVIRAEAPTATPRAPAKTAPSPATVTAASSSSSGIVTASGSFFGVGKGRFDPNHTQTPEAVAPAPAKTAAPTVSAKKTASK